MTPSATPHLRQRDEESGSADDGSGSPSYWFDIPPKNAPVERLRRWRRAALVLNASRRFRYTLDLKKEEEKEQTRSRIRAHAQVIRAALLFKAAAERAKPGTPAIPVLPSGGFGIGEEQLTKMTRDHDFSALQNYGEVKGLSNLLKTDIDGGISADDVDILHRRNVFGANTYPQKKGRSFWVFLWEACQDLTLIMLMVAAVLSLVLGIKTELSVTIDSHYNSRISMRRSETYN